MSDAAIDVFPVSASIVPPIEPAPSRTHAWKDGGSFGFHDLLDTINPLQHIPVVSAIYRWLTGDTPGNVARIVGDGGKTQIAAADPTASSAAAAPPPDPPAASPPPVAAAPVPAAPPMPSASPA